METNVLFWALVNVGIMKSLDIQMDIIVASLTTRMSLVQEKVATVSFVQKEKRFHGTHSARNKTNVPSVSIAQQL